MTDNSGLGRPPSVDLPARIASKIHVDPETGCWLWQAQIQNGYGYVRWNGKKQRAHRVVYELIYGPIESGLVLDHLCRNRSCVRPHHIEKVPASTNHARSTGWAGGRCKRGHTLTPGNIYTRPSDGKRRCRKCNHLSAKRQRGEIHA